MAGEVQLFVQIEDPGRPVGFSHRRTEEDALEMPELPGDRQHLAGRQGAVAEEYRDAVAGERGIGETSTCWKSMPATVAPDRAARHTLPLTGA
jgi:hypothetical protein